MRASLPAAPHPESLLRVPLVRQMLEDPQIRLVPRSIDARWRYQHVIAAKLDGFNPLVSAVFYPVESFFAKWLRDPASSARAYNENDYLVKEVTFAVHDYLHAWAYLAINEIHPSLGFGTRPISRKNIEDFVFCHLLTEAVATVGLDYWYLCTTQLNDVCDIGTEMDRGLTVTYHQRFDHEYRRFAPDFDAQQRPFFDALATFYCTGVFKGFDVTAIQQSPVILRWLRHELTYGGFQRKYAREWLAFLSPEDIHYDADQGKAPVEAGKPWQRRLMKELGKLLWEKVKEGQARRFAFRFGEDVWRAPRAKAADFRFVNLNAFASIDEALRARASQSPASDRCRAQQLVSRFDYASFDPGLLKAVPLLEERADAGMIAQLFRGQKLTPEPKHEPRDLFFPS